MSYLPLEAHGDDSKFKSSDQEQADIAIQVILEFLNSFPAQMGTYVGEVYKLLSLISEKIKNVDTKYIALSTLPALINVAKLQQNINYLQLGKQIFSNLWEVFVSEQDPSYKAQYCCALQKTLEYSGPLFSKEELVSLLAKMEEELKKSEIRRQTILDNIDLEEEPNQEDVEQNIKLEHNIEDDFKIEIANLFGKIFESHKQVSLDLFYSLYKDHIIPCSNNPTSINLEYSVFLIDDSIEHLGTFLPADVLNSLYQILAKNFFFDFMEIK